MSFQKFDLLPKTADKYDLSEDVYDHFLDEVQGINPLISKYNKAVDDQDKASRIEALRAILQALDWVDIHSIPDSRNSKSIFYIKKSELFLQIREALAKDGISSLVEVAPNNASDISGVVANMSPEKAEQLAIFLRNKKDASADELKNILRGVYPAKTTAEEIRWHEFLDNNTIVFLGGYNSLSFKVTNILDLSEKVLKIDNSLGRPRHMEHYLRGRLAHVLTTMGSFRQIEIPHETKQNKVLSRTLLVTDFCTDGSLDAHSEIILLQATQTNNFQPIHSAAANMMAQMAQVFIDIQKANCCFTDAKLPNWLVDNQNKIRKIRIADTKSLTATENGKYDLSLGNDLSAIFTPGFMPREAYSPIFNVEPFHASLLGRNLYIYLSGQWPDCHEWPENINMDLPVFKGKVGTAYKHLIESLIVDDPKYRISLVKAKKTLNYLACISDPMYNTLVQKRRELDQALGSDLKPLCKSLLKEEAKRPDFSLETTLQKLQAVLEQLEEVNKRSEALMREIDKFRLGDKQIHNYEKLNMIQKNRLQRLPIPVTLDSIQANLKESEGFLEKISTAWERLEKINASCVGSMQLLCEASINGIPFASMDELDQFKANVLQQAPSYEEACVRLEAFKNEMNAYFLQITEAGGLDRRYKEIVKHFNERRYESDDQIDRQMNNYLKDSWRELQKKMSTTDLGHRAETIKQHLAGMEETLAGLSKPENKEIDRLIDKFQMKGEKLWTIGNKNKYQEILKAARNIPIKERAQLLSSKDDSLNALWEAMAIERKVSIHIRSDNTSRVEKIHQKFVGKFTKEEAASELKKTGPEF